MLIIEKKEDLIFDKDPTQRLDDLYAINFSEPQKKISLALH